MRFLLLGALLLLTGCSGHQTIRIAGQDGSEYLLVPVQPREEVIDVVTHVDGFRAGDQAGPSADGTVAGVQWAGPSTGPGGRGGERLFGQADPGGGLGGSDGHRRDGEPEGDLASGGGSEGQGGSAIEPAANAEGLPVDLLSLETLIGNGQLLVVLGGLLVFLRRMGFRIVRAPPA